MAAFIDEGKSKIINYYNSNCDFIVKDAQALVGQEKYSEAIYNLSLVPDVCKDCYFECKDLLVSVYQKKIDSDGATKLSEAKIVWSGQKNINTAEKVLNILIDINPKASCSNEVNLLTKQINDKLIDDEKARLELALKKYNDKLNIEKQQIEAYREVAVEYAKNQPKTVTYNNIYWR